MDQDAMKARVDRLNRWRPQIERALKSGGNEMPWEELVYSVMAAQRFLFDNGDGFAIVEVVHHTNWQAIHILIAGGKQEALYELEKTVADFGRVLGAKKLTIMGRPGFKRRLYVKGWKSPMAYFEKEI